VLKESWRKIDYGGFFHDRKGGPGVHCDNYSFLAGWYSLQPGDAPSPGLPTAPPPRQFRGNSEEEMRTCGTHVTPWASRAPPPVGEPPADVTIKFAYKGDETNGGSYAKSYQTHVVACHGYVLYFLNPATKCQVAYCAL
jgi:hypothetical protein